MIVKRIKSYVVASLVIVLLNGCALVSIAGIGIRIAVEDANQQYKWEQEKYWLDFYGRQSIEVNCWAHPGVDPKANISFEFKSRADIFGVEALHCNGIGKSTILPLWRPQYEFTLARNTYQLDLTNPDQSKWVDETLKSISFTQSYQNAQRLDIHIYPNNETRMLFITGYPNHMRWIAGENTGKKSKIPSFSPNYPYPLNETAPPQVDIGLFFNEAEDLPVQNNK
ncbi:hypothetical protein ACFQNF_14850 [Iodobacter arcticus]|uniref:Lipoprotein n=1 Tax=Iodobacter arcticus TaxID=590593 RepID=A0ABW2QZP1_9NEIS